MKEEKEMTTQGNLYYITMLVFSIPGPGPTSLCQLVPYQQGVCMCPKAAHTVILLSLLY
jgi:hypothetical protein